MPVNATHPYTEDELAKIRGSQATPVTEDQARQLLAAPPGQRPRIRGLLWDNVQIVAVSSEYYLDKYSMSALWVSGTTLADLITPQEGASS